MMKFPFSCRRVLSWSAVVSLALMLTSCYFYKDKDDAHQEEDLIANIEGYGIDTIAVEPGDTLCSARVDDVLRHYPEFYHAAKTKRLRRPMSNGRKWRPKPVWAPRPKS